MFLGIMIFNLISVNRSFHFLKTIKKRNSHTIHIQTRVIRKMVLPSLKELLTEKVNPINSIKKLKIRKKPAEGKQKSKREKEWDARNNGRHRNQHDMLVSLINNGMLKALV